jgi:hypothetical protein
VFTIWLKTILGNFTVNMLRKVSLGIRSISWSHLVSRLTDCAVECTTKTRNFAAINFSIRKKFFTFLLWNMVLLAKKRLLTVRGWKTLFFIVSFRFLNDIVSFRFCTFRLRARPMVSPSYLKKTQIERKKRTKLFFCMWKLPHKNCKQNVDSFRKRYFFLYVSFFCF